MTDYTTIRITKSTKKKIDKMNTGGMPISHFLEGLMDSIGGCVVDDVVEISRDPIAYILWQLDYDNPENNSKTPITFQELKNARVRDEFYPSDAPLSKNMMRMEAEVIFRDDISVVLRVLRKTIKDGKPSYTTHLVHADLF